MKLNNTSKNFFIDDCVRVMSGDSEMYCVSFDGQGLLASGHDDGPIQLWNVKTGECISRLNGHKSCVMSVCFDGEGLLASGSGDETIKLWNVT